MRFTAAEMLSASSDLCHITLLSQRFTQPDLNKNKKNKNKNKTSRTASCSVRSAVIDAKWWFQERLESSCHLGRSNPNPRPDLRHCRGFIMHYDTTWSVTQHLRKLACSSQCSELHKCLGQLPQICATFLRRPQKVPLLPCLGFGAVYRQTCLCLPNPRLLSAWFAPLLHIRRHFILFYSTVWCYQTPPAFIITNQ